MGPFIDPMTLRPALLLVSLTTFAAMFAAVRSGRSTGSHFEIPNVPVPATNDAATTATFRVVGGQADRVSAPLDVLHDGLIPTGQDDPGRNFFFAPGSDGGLILVDLGKVVEVASVATYSWHHGSRAAQTYSLYAASGELPELPKWPDAPKGDWSLVEKVDTSGIPDGQHGVLIDQTDKKPLGKFRYLLFDVKPNGSKAPFNQTFFSEIDVIDAEGPELIRIKKPKLIVQKLLHC